MTSGSHDYPGRTLRSWQLAAASAACLVVAVVFWLLTPGGGLLIDVVTFALLVAGILAGVEAVRRRAVGGAPSRPPAPASPHATPAGANVVVVAGTNGFAIASMIFGILGGWVLALVFGLIALSQIGRTGESGRGMAIAGIVLGCVGGAVTVALVVFVYFFVAL